MARPQKVGLEYFPLDVDLFEDPKAEKITAQFGLIGDAILVRLLCRIYREGYCTAFDEDVARAIAMKAGERELYDTVMDVVDKLLQTGFFDEGMYRKFGILTSRGIQKRYERICADSGRKISRVPEQHRLLGRTCPLPEGETGGFEDESPVEYSPDEGEIDSPAVNTGLPGYKPAFAAQETPQSKEKKSTVKSTLDDVDVRDNVRARARGDRPGRGKTGYAKKPAQAGADAYMDAGMEPVAFAAAIRGPDAGRAGESRSPPRPRSAVRESGAKNAACAAF